MQIKRSQLETFYYLKHLCFPLIELLLLLIFLSFLFLRAAGYEWINDYRNIYDDVIMLLIFIVPIHLILLTRKLNQVVFFRTKIKAKTLLEELNSESFHSVEGLPATLYQESEHWIYVKKKLIAKNTVIGCRQTTTVVKGSTDHFEFYLLDGSCHDIRMSYDRNYTKLLYDHLTNTLPYRKILSNRPVIGILNPNKASRNLVREYSQIHGVSKIYQKNDLLLQIIANQNS